MNTALSHENYRWEPLFTIWAKPPLKTEELKCQNAIRSIHNAVKRSGKLRSKKIHVFVQGSYRNNVNVRNDSDIDIGVLCYDFFDAFYPPGLSKEDFGNHSYTNYSYRELKDDLEEALVSHFGVNAVRRGNKAFDIKGNSYHADIDVVPLVELRKYNVDKTYIAGTKLISDAGNRIENYPERLLLHWPDRPLHYENGVEKNKRTHRAYKGVVRIIKKIRNELAEGGLIPTDMMPGYFIECMVWNVPDEYFQKDTWEERVRGVLGYLWYQTLDDYDSQLWKEVDNIKYLFDYDQPLTIPQVNELTEMMKEYLDKE